MGVTPDGPRGPRYELKAGLLNLAQLTRPPLMCFHAIFGCAIRVGTWDRFVIPLSFSKVTIVLDELLDVRVILMTMPSKPGVWKRRI